MEIDTRMVVVLMCISSNTERTASVGKNVSFMSRLCQCHAFFIMLNLNIPCSMFYTCTCLFSECSQAVAQRQILPLRTDDRREILLFHGHHE